jgi:hypothetical protein
MMTYNTPVGITWCSGLLLVAVVMFDAPARAEITVGAWEQIFNGIDYATGYADSAEPRLQRVNCLRIDLTNSYIRFFATPHSGGNETVTQKTGDFLTQYDLQVAINANFFAPFNSSASIPYETNPSGALVSQGSVVSPSQSNYEELRISQTNTAWFNASPPASLNGVWMAVAGNTMLLVDGQVLTTTNSDAHPRTAVGISENELYVYMMTIDGRQNGVSEGATYVETAEWLDRFGAYDGLNLDGGGSTTMVMDDGQSGYDLLNTPVGFLNIASTERLNGSNFGIRVILEADFDEDGDVDQDDLGTWEAGFGATSARHSDGDANNDQIVNGLDFLTWQRQFSGGATASAGTASVPEPTTCTLALAALCLMVGRRRGRSA